MPKGVKLHKWKCKRLKGIYYGMKERCYSPNCHKYEIYGKRGIRICNEWLSSPGTFEEWALNNGYSDKLTIDRIDVNGNYEPNNCRWITAKEQMSNMRRNRFITYNGETHTLTEWAEKIGISEPRLWHRLENNYPLELLFTNKDLRKRKVNMYLPKSHKLVNTFESANEAAAYLTGTEAGNTNIRRALNETRKTAYGFCWEYAD